MSDLEPGDVVVDDVVDGSAIVDPTDTVDETAEDIGNDTVDTIEPSDASRPDVERPEFNLCGGTEALSYDETSGRPGASCGPFEDGVLICNGPEALLCIAASVSNECGGPGELLEPLGAPCGCGGVYVCDEANDGSVVCADTVQRNSCGGCEPLDGRPGFFCETSEVVGRYVCQTFDSLVCVGGAGNACGGEGTLVAGGVATPGVFPGDVCDSGACGSGRYVCDGVDGLRCQSDRPCNTCGGTRSLAGRRGSTCGACGAGTWECDGTDRVACQGAITPNACGGCEALPLLPGDLCTPDAVGEDSQGDTLGVTLCRDGGSACTAVSLSSDDAGPVRSLNACGGTEPLLVPAGLPSVGQPATLAATCGSCNRGELVCDGADAVRCTVPEAQQTNVCGGCTPITARPNAPCGTCGTGRLQCDSAAGPTQNTRVICQGDLGNESGRNACGGCGTLPGVANNPCGTCLVWACEGTRLQCTPLTEGPECDGVLACNELTCEDDNRACVETDGVVDAVCGECASGFVDDGDGGCRALVTCDDLDCEEQFRWCVVADGVPDARCGDCGAEYIDDGDGGCRPIVTCEGRVCEDDGRVCIPEVVADSLYIEGIDAQCGACADGLIADDGACRSVDTCETLNCEGTFQDCTAGGTGEDAVCGECLDDYVDDGLGCRPVETCLLRTCETENRECMEATASTDAECGACQAAFVDDEGICRLPLTCADLGCTATNRDCVPESPGLDAECADCVEGYVAAGESCELVDCGPLTAPDDGLVDVTETVHESVATYECAEGYDLVGDVVRSCGSDGAWTGAAPDCVPVDCGDLIAPDNGSVSAGTTTLGEVRTFGCDAGYTLQGDESATCTSVGAWSGDVPFCARSLAERCTADDECGAGAWCPTDTLPELRRCSPRLNVGSGEVMEFVFVPAGTFTQGGSDAVGADIPYSATLTANYWMGRTEVTQRQWMRIVNQWNRLPDELRTVTGWEEPTPQFGTSPSCFQQNSGTNCSSGSASVGPVEMVSWWDAVVLANLLSELHGLSVCHLLTECIDDPANSVGEGCPSSLPFRYNCNGGFRCDAGALMTLDCDGYRLATESEWERAARSGNRETWYWGTLDAALTADQYAWFDESSLGRTQFSRTKTPNAYGLYGVSGNVAEWVWDWFGTTYPVGSVVDYVAEMGESTQRGVRGGSWRDSLGSLQSGARDRDAPNYRSRTIGFRLAQIAPTPSDSVCSLIPVPVNTWLEVSSLFEGATATYRCHDGYVLAGESERSCQANGTWNGTEPRCLAE